MGVVATANITLALACVMCVVFVVSHTPQSVQ